MNKKILLLILIFASLNFAEENSRKEDISFFLMFNNIGHNLLYSFAHNYGLNYAVGTFATYGMIESGVDWKWNKYADENNWLHYAGRSAGITGFILPVAAPLALYFGSDNRETQITGLALGQSALLAFSISSSIKAITGRHQPAIGDDDRPKDDFSDDFKFGFFRRGVFHGWPSSHTAVAFATASTLVELYPGNTAVAIGAYTYATFIGAGMSVLAHWGSDIIAGALMGVAIGKTVGKNFYALKNKEKEESTVSFYIVPNAAGVVWRF